MYCKKLAGANSAGQKTSRRPAGAKIVFSTTTIIPRIRQLVKSRNCYNSVTIPLQFCYRSITPPLTRWRLCIPRALEPPSPPRRKAETLTSWKLDSERGLHKLATTVSWPATSWKAGSWNPTKLCSTSRRKLEIRRSEISRLRFLGAKCLTFCKISCIILV